MNWYNRKMKAKKCLSWGVILTSLCFLSACQSETTDLYQVESPSLQGETRSARFAEPEIQEPSFENPEFPELPETGEVLSIEIPRPPELSEVDDADLINVTQNISLTNQETRPQLDLLFVIDDSNSMETHQNNLAAAMEDFVEELSHLDLLDYRIAVTPIYDSRRYFKRGQVGDDRYEEGVTEWSRPLQGEQNYVATRNFYRLGSLLPFIDNQTGQIKRPIEKFATTSTQLSDLRETLKVGAQEYIERDEVGYESNGNTINNGPRARPTDQDEAREFQSSLTEVLIQEAVGPRFEEMLSPMIAALNSRYLIFGNSASHYRSQYPATHPEDDNQWTPPGLEDPNREEQWSEFSENHNSGFIRQDAHLGVIFVTDTVDQSVDINPAMAAEALRQLKGGQSSRDKISTYGVLHKNSVSFDLQNRFSSQWSRRNCGDGRVDDDIRGREGYDRPQKLESFLRMTSGRASQGSNILNICSGTYGEDLPQIAKDLFDKSVQRGEYNLEHIPMGEIRVYFADNPERSVPVCGANQGEALCWNILIQPGVRKLILINQGELGTRNLVVEYQSVDPRTANRLNSNRIGQ